MMRTVGQDNDFVVDIPFPDEPRLGIARQIRYEFQREGISFTV